MAYKQRMRGAQNRVLQFSPSSGLHVVTITWKAGVDISPGTLYGTATQVGGAGTTIELSVSDVTAGEGPVVIEVDIDPADFVTELGKSAWQIEVGTSDGGSGEDEIDYVMFSGGVIYRGESEAYLTQTHIASTVIEEAS